MVIKIKSLILLSLISLYLTIDLDESDIQEILRRQKAQKEKEINEDDDSINANRPPNLAMFYFYPERKHEIEKFSRILQEFLSTMGISAHMANVHDNELIVTYPRGKFLNTKIIKENFKDVIEKIEVADFDKQS